MLQNISIIILNTGIKTINRNLFVTEFLLRMFVT